MLVKKQFYSEIQFKAKTTPVSELPDHREQSSSAIKECRCKETLIIIIFFFKIGMAQKGKNLIASYKQVKPIILTTAKNVHVFWFCLLILKTRKLNFREFK